MNDGRARVHSMEELQQLSQRCADAAAWIQSINASVPSTDPLIASGIETLKDSAVFLSYLVQKVNRRKEGAADGEA